MRTLAAAASAALSAFGPAAAVANQGLAPGVHIDPGSPAGKVYVIPITAARSETAGAGQPAGAAANGNPPLFGIGITPSGKVTGSGTTRGSAKSTGSSVKQTVSPATPARSRSREAQTASGRSVAVVATTPGIVSADQSGPGGDGWPALAGGGALVLVLGGGGGLMLRRRW